MEYVVSASVAFDAGHISNRFAGCGGDHGHHYEVTVALGSKIDADAAAEAFADLESSLMAIRMEFDGRSLNLMLAPSDPTLIGLASFIWQRLTMDYSTLREVTVRESTGRTISVHSS